MPYEKYREARKEAARELRAYLKGRLVYKAAEIYIRRPDGVEIPYTKENISQGAPMNRTFPPFKCATK